MSLQLRRSLAMSSSIYSAQQELEDLEAGCHRSTVNPNQFEKDGDLEYQANRNHLIVDYLQCCLLIFRYFDEKDYSQS